MAKLWEAPWYYLAGIPCLSRGTTVKEANGNEHNLIQRLKEIMAPAEVQQVFAANQPGRPIPPLVSRMKQVAMKGLKAEYPWDRPWPTGLPVRLRRATGSPAGDVILGPNALTVVCPLPCDAADWNVIDGNIQNADHTIPAYSSAADYNPATDVLADNFLTNADECVWTCDGRTFFEERWRNGRAKEGIVAWGAQQNRPVTLPASLQVTVYEQKRDPDGEMQPMFTKQTYLEGHSDHLHLHLGWRLEEDCANQPMSFDKWPCGAFRT